MGIVTKRTSGQNNNFIPNGRFDVGVAGWTASGGNFTIAVTSTSGQVLLDDKSALLSANGLQTVGDYISTPFSIGLGDTNRQLSLEFYFLGISGFDSGDMVVIIHDGTNEITPATTSVPGGNGLFRTTWNASSSTSYTLRFKANVSSSFTVVIDGVNVSSREVTFGSAIGPWTNSGPLQITATSVNPTKGSSVSYDQLWWRRVGSNMELLGRYKQTSAGTTGNGTYLIQIPGGYSIDTSMTHTDGGTYGEGVVGDGVFGQTGVTMLQVKMLVYDSTHLSAWAVYEGSSAAGGRWGSSYAGTFGNADENYHFFASVPIVGWTSDVVVSSSRVEYALNTSTNNGDDTTTFSYGPAGATIPAVTNIYKKRIRFQSPIQLTDDIEIQADWDNQGKWNRWEDQGYDNSNGKYGPTWEYVSGSITDIDVWMRGVHYARFRNSDAAQRTFTQENSAGSKWRVRKSANPLGIDVPATTTVSYMRRSNGVSHGSSNTNVTIYGTLEESIGTNITYVNSSTNGDSFLIGVSGIYSVSFSLRGNSGGGILADLCVGNSITNTINDSNMRAHAGLDPAGVNRANVSWTGYISAGKYVYTRSNGDVSGVSSLNTISISGPLS